MLDEDPLVGLYSYDPEIQFYSYLCSGCTYRYRMVLVVQTQIQV